MILTRRKLLKRSALAMPAIILDMIARNGD